jgi:hypothetical protein
MKEERLAVNALPDARMLVDEQKRVLLLTGPVTRYDHGVIGDSIEASSITLLESAPSPGIVRVIDIEPPDVIEGIMPIWADINGDSVREIIVTLSDPTLGAKIVIYSEQGDRIAESAPAGTGYRWRNQLAVAPFGSPGEQMLVDVLKPHLDGIVEFFSLKGRTLDLEAEIPGFTSHVRGSRNLDLGIAGDFDADRRVDVLVPDKSLKSLRGISLYLENANQAWSLPLPAKLASNLIAVRNSKGQILVGAGLENGELFIWQP